MSEQNDRHGTSLLILGDDPAHAGVVEAILNKHQYLTVVVRNDPDWVEEVKREKPKMILLGTDLPGWDRFGAFEILRRDQDTKDIPVMFMTHDFEGTALEGVCESGGTDFIRKPVNQRELLVRVKSALNRQDSMGNASAKNRLAEMLETIGSINHELNQPLMSVSGYSELLLMEVPEDSPYFEKINKIKSQVERMAEITRRLVSFTKNGSEEILGDDV